MPLERIALAGGHGLRAAKRRAESKRETPRVNAAETYAWAIAGGACSRMRAQTNGDATQTGCSAGTKQKWKTGTGTATRGAAAIFSQPLELISVTAHSCREEFASG
jgi:hypothetical protein